MESDSIDGFAKKNSDFSFINASSGGLGFKTIPNRRLKDIPLRRSFDIRGKIHQLIENNRLTIKKDEFLNCIDNLVSSLTEARSYISNILLELKDYKNGGELVKNGKVIFNEMELKSLDAYDCFLKNGDFAIERFFFMENGISCCDDDRLKFDLLKYRYDYLFKLVEGFLTKLTQK